ncbi:uncharacterized protein LOC135931981 [Gordionus sp. m RMFG-2023]|uniref:uncharacterized protein LOC135931981 n=1 Tax=Gordionus sp. m RMFG-2023 TaxID=3053472 RepID=UPI0031FBFB47
MNSEIEELARSCETCNMRANVPPRNKADKWPETDIPYFAGKYGLMETLVSDGGPAFKGRVFNQLCDRWNIKHLVSPPHYPRRNSPSEMFLGRKTRKELDFLKERIKQKEDTYDDKFKVGSLVWILLFEGPVKWGKGIISKNIGKKKVEVEIEIEGQEGTFTRHVKQVRLRSLGQVKDMGDN